MFKKSLSFLVLLFLSFFVVLNITPIWAADRIREQQHFLSSLQGEWRDTTYDGQKVCNEIFFYQLTSSGTSEFTLKLTRTEHRSAECAQMMASAESSLVGITIDGTLTGQSITATRTLVNDYSRLTGGGSCGRTGVKREIATGTGEVSSDGKRIHLTFSTDEFDWVKCRYTGGTYTFELPLVKVR